MNKSAHNCCSDQLFVQDKVCTNWRLAAAGSQIIYTDNISPVIYGTGYIKLDPGSANVIATFSKTGIHKPIQTLIIYPGGSTSFSVARFDTISLTSTTTAQGEFCITVRYSL